LNAISGIREAMLESGLRTSDPIVPDGRLRRVRWEGDPAGRRNGWYVLHEGDPPAGAFGCWKRGVNEKWCAKGSPNDSWTAEQRRALKERIAQRRVEQQAEMEARHASARSRTDRDWSRAVPADPEHPYLRRKRVQPHGIKQIGDRLQIPVCGLDGTIRGLQRIWPDGRKLYMPGTQAAGSYYPIGKPKDDVIILAEGFATAATLHQATGWPAAVCFSAGNLEPVARQLRARRPEHHLIVAADDDRATAGNPGLKAATSAAEAVGGILAVPVPEPGADGGDFNDMALAVGESEVRRVLRLALRQATRSWPLGELLGTRFPSPNWLIDLIMPDGLLLIVGAPKCGKSRLATHIALAVGNGGAPLGFFNARAAGVLYVDLEQAPPQCQARFRDLLEDGVIPPHVTVNFDWPMLGDGAIPKLEKFLDKNPGVRLVIVDTLARIWGGGSAGPRRVGNAYHQEYEILTGIKKVADERMITIALVHHESKFSGSDRLYRASGTMAMTGVPDVIWQLSRPRGESGAELYVTGRKVIERTYQLFFDPRCGTWMLLPGEQEAHHAAN
jgi:putative DNA primase/helicase